MKLLKSLTWMFIILLALGFVGCSDDDDDDDNPTGPTTTDHFEDLFALDGGFGDNITSSALYAELTGTTPAAGELFLIDFRSADHYNYAHIDGAVNWAITDLMDNLDQIPADAKVICICYSGQTASQASSALNLLGYDAWNLKFGMCGWTSNEDINLGKWANLAENDVPLVTDPYTLDDSFDYPDRALETEDVMEAAEYYLDMYLSNGTKNMSCTAVYELDMDEVTILNYWSADMYNDGHLAGAVQANPIDMDVLEGVDPELPVVVYCHTGQTSSKITAWLNMLGYDAYSMLYGVNAIDQEFPGLTTYHAPDQDYPCVGTFDD